MAGSRAQTVFIGLDAVDLTSRRSSRRDGEMPTLAAPARRRAPASRRSRRSGSSSARTGRRSTPVPPRRVTASRPRARSRGGTLRPALGRSDRRSAAGLAAPLRRGLPCRVARRAARAHRRPTQRRPTRRVGLPRPSRRDAFVPGGVRSTSINAQVRRAPHRNGAARRACSTTHRVTIVHRAGRPPHARRRTRRCSTTMLQGVRAKRALSLDLLDEERLGSLLHGVRRRALHRSPVLARARRAPSVARPDGARPTRRRPAAARVRDARPDDRRTTSNDVDDEHDGLRPALVTGCGRTTTARSCSTPCCGGSTSTRPGIGDRGWLSRAADVGMRNVAGRGRARPRSRRRPNVRRRLAARVPLGYFDEDIPMARRSAGGGPQPNDSVYGSIRLNLERREPNGRIAADRYARHARAGSPTGWPSSSTSRRAKPPSPTSYFTDDHYERTPATRWAISSSSGTATRRSRPCGHRRPASCASRTTSGAPATTIDAVCSSRAAPASHPVDAPAASRCSTSRRRSPRRSASTSPTSTGRRAPTSFPTRRAAPAPFAGSPAAALDGSRRSRRASRRSARRNDRRAARLLDRDVTQSALAGAHHDTARPDCTRTRRGRRAPATRRGARTAGVGREGHRVAAARRRT